MTSRFILFFINSKMRDFHAFHHHILSPQNPITQHYFLCANPNTPIQINIFMTHLTGLFHLLYIVDNSIVIVEHVSFGNTHNKKLDIKA